MSKSKFEYLDSIFDRFDHVLKDMGPYHSMFNHYRSEFENYSFMIREYYLDGSIDGNERDILEYKVKDIRARFSTLINGRINWLAARLDESIALDGTGPNRRFTTAVILANAFNDILSKEYGVIFGGSDEKEKF